MADAAPVRIVIVDDHETLRRTLGLFMRHCDELELVAEASSGQEALDACARHLPDVVLMDILLPGMDGLVATRAIRRRHPGIQVIGMTGMQDKQLEPAALQAGAASLLYKGVLSERLLDAIGAAMHDA